MDKYFTIYKDERKKEKPKTGCWALDYIPTKKNFILPLEKFKSIFNLVKDGDIPINININGPNGCGKLMLIKIIIKYCFSIDIDTLNDDPNNDFLKYDGNIYYLDLINNDIDINEFTNFIDRLSRYKILTSEMKYKVIIIPNIDKLKNNRLLQIINTKSEKESLRFISTTSSFINIPKKYKSGCYNFRMTNMNDTEFKTFYSSFKKTYKTNEIKLKQAYNIYKNTNYNLKKTIIKLQVKNNNINNPKKIVTDIDIFGKAIANLLNYCIEKKYNKIRELLYNLNSLGYNSNNLLRGTITILCKQKNIKPENISNIIKLTAETSHSISKVSQDIYYLENYYFKLCNLI